VTPYYYAAANAINWSMKTERIGERKKPLQPKTLRRIEIGLRKYARHHPFTVQVNKTTDRTRDTMTEPFPTQTGDNGLGLVNPPPFLINLSHAGEDGRVSLPSKDALPTQTARQELGLVEPFVLGLNHPNTRSTAVLHEPLSAQTSYDDQSLVVPWPFIVDHLGTQEGYRDRDILRWLSTLCASGNHQSVVVPPYLLDLHGTSTTHEITDPLGAFSAGGLHHALIQPELPAWLMTYYNNSERLYETHEEAMPTATTLDRHALVTTVELPCQVEDCGFRMLDPDEIQAGMAFPGAYKVTGTRREQVKQLGNAVTPPAMKLLVERCIESLS
jgi:DNA (cytosine-5)-methyltransferase 1